VFAQLSSTEHVALVLAVFVIALGIRDGSCVVALGLGVKVEVAVSSWVTVFDRSEVVEVVEVVEAEVCRCVVVAVVDSRLRVVDVVLVCRVTVRVVDIMIRVCVCL
jgi:hypothetical protein